MDYQQKREQMPSSHLPDRGNTDASATIKDYLYHLYSMAQQLSGQTQGLGKRLSQEVASITQDQVQLILYSQEPSKHASTSAFQHAATFRVQYAGKVYGILSFTPHPPGPAHPGLSLEDVERLAGACAYIFHTFEYYALLDRQKQRYDLQNHVSLSRREKEVLELIGQGCNQEEMAKALAIEEGTITKHRQSIFAKLGVRSECDAIQFAYHAGLFSPLDDVTAEHDSF